MRKSIILLMLFVGMNAFAQQELCQKVKQILQSEHPELKLDNKLIVINVWSQTSAESREKNIQLNKAYTTYEYAKLKGGVKGMIGVIICTDDDVKQQEITLGKDKVSKAISISNKSGLELDQLHNVIFDSAGNEVKRDVTTDLFKEINNLITR